MSAQAHEPPPTIEGYDFVKFLASGGFSTVYLYRETSEHVEREVAVKALKLVGTTELMRQQFTTEARAMTRLGDHDNIVTVYRVGIAEDGRPYLIMRYYPGDDLMKLIASRHRFSVGEVLRIGVEIGCAVHTAHRSDILHKDIKPANILTARYRDHMRCALTDFGIAGRIDATSEELMLSVPWSPAEIVTGRSGATVRSDVYSLGATLWHLLAGHAPFHVDGPDTAEAMELRIAAAPRPRTGRTDVPESLEALLASAMAVQLDRRPASAEAFAESLREIEAELQLPMTPMALLAGDDDRPPTDRTVPPPPHPVGTTAPRVLARPEPTTIRPHGTPRIQETVVSTAIRPQETFHWQDHAPALPLPEPAYQAWAEPVEHTRLRTVAPAVPAAEPVVDPARSRRILPIAMVGGAVLAALVVGVVLMSGGDPSSPGPPSSAPSSAAAQDPGIPGQNLPPGEPTVTATRIDTGTVRFSWTYSAALATDTFSWQTADGTQRGTAKAPSIDLPVTGQTQLCLQVKVFRADGSFGSTEWSKAACGGR